MNKPIIPFESKMALESLFDQDVERIVGDLTELSDPGEIQVVATRLRGTRRWPDFVRFCIDPATQWSHPKPVATLCELLDHETLQVLVPVRSWEVEQSIGQFGVDQYWKDRIRYYIANKDLDRAWDEIIKAFRGVEEKSMGPTPVRRFDASGEALAILLLELGHAVGEAELGKTTWRGKTYSGHVHEMRLVLSRLPDDTLDSRRRATNLSFKLHAYFGQKKSLRRKNRRERRLTEK